jgi:hypothetical protein
MNDIIDGNMRFIVDETNGDLRLYLYQSIALKRKDIHFIDYRMECIKTNEVYNL